MRWDRTGDNAGEEDELGEFREVGNGSGKRPSKSRGIGAASTKGENCDTAQIADETGEGGAGIRGGEVPGGEESRSTGRAPAEWEIGEAVTNGLESLEVGGGDGNGGLKLKGERRERKKEGEEKERERKGSGSHWSRGRRWMKRIMVREILRV